MTPANREGKRSRNLQFIKFLAVGGLNTLFGYGVFAGFVALKFHYSLAALLSTLLGILFNFKTYGTLVFKNTSNRLIFRFFGVYGFTYALTVLAIAGLKSLGLSSYAAGAVTAIPMALISFSLNRRFVFGKAQSGRGPEPEAAQDQLIARRTP